MRCMAVSTEGSIVRAATDIVHVSFFNLFSDPGKKVLTVTNTGWAGVAEYAVFVVRCESAGLGKVSGWETVGKGCIVDGLHVHVVINLCGASQSSRSDCELDCALTFH
jgi:hypothetical protein